MPRLVLINGAPGSGKSTLALRLAQQRPRTLALDVDTVKHALGGWEDDPTGAGLRARRLALVIAGEHLRWGKDVVLGQYLARPDFIDQLDQLAVDVGARFVELILDVDVDTLAARLAGRAAEPATPEQTVNSRLVAPEDASSLVESLAHVRRTRPAVVPIDARGSVEDTLLLIGAQLQEAS